MTTYWITNIECPLCSSIYDYEKVWPLPFQDVTGIYYFEHPYLYTGLIEKTLRRDIADIIKKRITSDLKNEPSNSWSEEPRPGMIKVLVRRSRPVKKEPYVCEYELRCYYCGYFVKEDEFYSEKERLQTQEEKLKIKTTSQTTLLKWI